MEVDDPCGRLWRQNACLRLGSKASSVSYSYLGGHRTNKELEMGSREAKRSVKNAPHVQLVAQPAQGTWGRGSAVPGQQRRR
jgi:hypothetical protein